MDTRKWQRVEDLLDKYQIKPMVGIIPHNEDPMQVIDKPDATFWDKARAWQKKGWAIAMHGYNHVYGSSESGDINPMWNRSEFAGLSLDEQRTKIREGISTLMSQGLHAEYFFAPSHTFDRNTIEALKLESDIRVISDTIALRPYMDDDFLFIPQIAGSCRKIAIPGVYTFCYHPNGMGEESFVALENFLTQHATRFVDFESVKQGKYDSLSIFDKWIKFMFFAQRKLRNLK
jgi:hypothetical protein